MLFTIFDSVHHLHSFHPMRFVFPLFLFIHSSSSSSERKRDTLTAISSSSVEANASCCADDISKNMTLPFSRFVTLSYNSATGYSVSDIFQSKFIVRCFRQTQVPLADFQPSVTAVLQLSQTKNEARHSSSISKDVQTRRSSYNWTMCWSVWSTKMESTGWVSLEILNSTDSIAASARFVLRANTRRVPPRALTGMLWVSSFSRSHPCLPDHSPPNVQLRLAQVAYQVSCEQ